MLNGLTQCGVENPPGTEVDFYYTCSCELTGDLPTAAANGGTEPGDEMILDAPFDFSNAPVGEGFFRKATIIVDTGEVMDALEGEVGGQSFTSSFKFAIKGTDAVHLQFAADMAKLSGCLVGLMKDRNGNTRRLGSRGVPATVKALTGSTGAKAGDRRGFDYELSANSGERPAMIYDADTHGIETTPNV